MSSQAQIDANRRNAKKSTGPRTPEGRAAVRLNGVTHGLSAKTLVLNDESESDFHAVFDSLEAEHQPSTPTEELLVSQLAMATWRLRRLYHLESSFISITTGDMELVFENYENLGPFDREAIAVNHDAAGPNTLSKFCRFEARLERSFYRALHELQRLRARRPAEAEKAAAEKEVEKPGLGLVCNSDPRKASQPKPGATPPPAAQPNAESTVSSPAESTKSPGTVTGEPFKVA
jgi:hypothetical protein